MTEIVLRGIYKTYQPHAVVALKNINLKIERGKILSIVGPSGCGKTTLLKIIAGLESMDAGTIFFNGSAIHSLPAHKRKAVIVFQNILLFPFLSVFENVAFGLRVQNLNHAAITTAVMRILEKMDLAETAQRKPHQLSGGQQQRIALARALVTKPDVLLLDEPLANLDRHIWRDMAELIINLQQEYRITTILVTHNQEEALLLGDAMAVIVNNTIEQVGNGVDLYYAPQTLQIARFFDTHNIFSGKKNGNSITIFDYRFTISDSNRYRTCPDGDVFVCVRPECIQYASQQENCIAGTIYANRFTGTHWRTIIQAQQCRWEIISEQCFAQNTPTHIYAHPDKIMLFPQ